MLLFWHAMLAHLTSMTQTTPQVLWWQRPQAHTGGPHCWWQNVFQLTISLSLTTINSIYLVSAWTEGLRTNLLDRLSPLDTRCSLIWSGLSSSLSPPLLSHSLSSVQSGHTEKQSCRRFFLVSVKCKHYFLNLSQTLRFSNQKSCKRNCRFKMPLHSIITLVLTDFSIITCVKIF